MSSDQVYLIDASIYIFRSYFALPDNWRSRNGVSTNAVYGYSNWLLELLEQQQPNYLAAAYDESLESGFRHRLSPDYKANRALPDEDLAFQLNACRQVADLLGIASFASDEYEADDIVGTLASISRQAGRQPLILSRDKDLAQLLQDTEQMWDFGSAAPRSIQELETSFGVPLTRLPDYLALMGDAIDNIPGVPGIGAKTAAAILQIYRHVDEVLANLEHLAQLPMRGAKTLADKIAPRREQLLLSRQLTEIYCQVPLAVSSDNLHSQLKWQAVNTTEFAEFCKFMGLGQRLVERALQLESV